MKDTTIILAENDKSLNQGNSCGNEDEKILEKMDGDGMGGKRRQRSKRLQKGHLGGSVG